MVSLDKGNYPDCDCAGTDQVRFHTEECAAMRRIMRRYARTWPVHTASAELNDIPGDGGTRPLLWAAV